MMKEMLTAFAEGTAKTIRIERMRQDVTLESLAEMANISPQFLCRLENARKTASIETYIKIAAALRLDLTDLFNGDKSVSLPADDALHFLISECSDLEKRVCLKAVEGILAGFRED
jgi:transcriptional regulator with XRE-family HTH domain